MHHHNISYQYLTVCTTTSLDVWQIGLSIYNNYLVYKLDEVT